MTPCPICSDPWPGFHADWCGTFELPRDAIAVKVERRTPVQPYRGMYAPVIPLKPEDVEYVLTYWRAGEQERDDEGRVASLFRPHEVIWRDGVRGLGGQGFIPPPDWLTRIGTTV